MTSYTLDAKNEQEAREIAEQIHCGEYDGETEYTTDEQFVEWNVRDIEELKPLTK